MTFLIGTIAIAGIPPFAGFFSKDEILANVYARDKGLWLTGMIVSALTTFYMFRLLFLTFFGKFRGTHHQKEHLHESPGSMTIPLVVLALLSVIGGFIGFPEVFHLPHWLHHYLSPVMEDSEIRALPAEITHLTEWSLMGVALIVIAIMFFIARSKYVSHEELPEPEDAKLKPLHRVVYHKYYVDEFYEGFILKPLTWISKQLKNIVEKELIDGFVNLSGQAAVWSGKVLRYAQAGMVSFYLFMMVLGALGLWIYFNLF
jgi:NADH-quinone oxidoreductase subunit L